MHFRHTAEDQEQMMPTRNDMAEQGIKGPIARYGTIQVKGGLSITQGAATQEGDSDVTPPSREWGGGTKEVDGDTVRLLFGEHVA